VPSARFHLDRGVLGTAVGVFHPVTMSTRGKEVRPFIDETLHEKLTIIAEYRDLQIAELASRLLEKAIVGEWHEVSILLERCERLGKRWKPV
jgi:hypothetical protein